MKGGKRGGAGGLLPEALYADDPLFPVGDGEEEEDRKSTQGSSDNKQIAQEPSSL